ncbi:MAG: TonB-dependent receptor [Alphaproteobacteria bacterium]|nr:TonB-dependent receptor [Alphaproteobacteria bacterium]
MPVKLGTVQSLTFLGALLATTAFTVPAYAQIETVIVTAQKRAEDIQSVPIAVTAYTSQDLAAHQVNGFKDIQFSTPNVSYTKANFTGTNFQIRGIGTQVISGDAESGIAFNIDDVYYANAPVDSGQFYDLESVQVLRGPQSTLYGRGATGGAVNVFSAKPKLDAFAASIDASYGTYNTSEIKGMVNMPIITDELAVRVAADWIRHDGYANNLDTAVPGGDHHPDSRDQWSARGLVRWQPTDNTTVDVIYSHADEDDTRMRAQKQLCHTDPTGVLGCLPDKLDTGPVNPNATFFNIPVSRQAAAELFAPELGGAAGLLGLFDLSQPFVATPGMVPANPRDINTDFTPTLKSHSNSITGEVKQKWTDWLDMTFVGGYADGSVLSQESYTNSPGQPFARGACGPTPTIDCSKGVFQATLDTYAGLGLVPASYADPVNGPYAFILNPNFAGLLPTGNFTNNSVIGGDINRYTNGPFAYDQSNGSSKQYSADLRFNTNFEGPLNFMLAAYYLNDQQWGDYYVASNTLDYGQTLLGAIAGPFTGVPGCATTGCIFGSTFYDNRTQKSTIESKAVYGEAYWQAIPDSLKITLGLRYTEDVKNNIGRITIFNGFEPIGSTNSDQALAICNQQGQPGCDFDPATTGSQLFEETHRQFDKLTGRLVVDYNPHWDLTDQTLLYASYARGYKAGGSNPGVQQGNLGVPATYEPESIDAYEIGAKNTLLDGRLQANLTAWYYNYGNYQISSVIANTSVNTNITAFLGGFEGEFLWAPNDAWQFNLNADWTQSRIGNTAQIDTRNPTGGDPNALLIKDGTLSATNAQNCVLYYHGNNFATDFANLSAFSGGIFFAPPGGTGSLAQYGVAHSAYGLCTEAELNNHSAGHLGQALDATNFTTTDPTIGGTLTGVPVNLQGNQLANTPPYSISFGAQYTLPMSHGYNLVSRADYYWQAPMFGRIFNGPADKLKSYNILNALITLNAPDNQWYVSAYARNLLGGNQITGEYLTSSSSGLYTGVFYNEPRNVGITIGARF